MSQIRELEASERSMISKLVDHSSPTDALIAYYGIDHPSNRAKVIGWFAGTGALLAILIAAQTGLDLFRPLYLPFAARKERLQAMLQAAKQDGLITLPLEQREWLGEATRLSNERILELYRLDPRKFEPILNVLVLEAGSQDSLPRYEIRSGENVRAAAGMNWLGRKFAEVYLEFEPGSERRRFPHSVLSSACAFVLDQGRIPLLRLRNGDAASQQVAREFGFGSVGTKTLFAEVAFVGDQPKSASRKALN